LAVIDGDAFDVGKCPSPLVTLALDDEMSQARGLSGDQRDGALGGLYVAALRGNSAGLLD
jgi:hypothetical protein